MHLASQHLLALLSVLGAAPGQYCRRYVAAVELLGERDEALEELRADLMDVKTLLRDVTLASTLVTPGQIPTM